MFEALTALDVQDDFVRYIHRVELVRREEQQAAPRVQRVQENREAVAAGAGGAGEAVEAVGAASVSRSSGATGGIGGGVQAGNPQQAISDKVPRNAPCPCGSGRKYKKCHGATV